MPYSDNRLRPKVLGWFQEKNWTPKTVLDVGCGAGANLEFYKPWWPESKWTGLEIFPPYVGMYDLSYRYDSLIMVGVQHHEDFAYDVVIFGDVLEHLEKKESWQVLNRAIEQAGAVVVALPVVHYPQGALHGNPWETHLSDWCVEEFTDRWECKFSITNDVTGSFILSRYDD